MKYKIVWSSVIFIVALHIFAIYGFYLGIHVKVTTVLCINIFVLFSGFGITVGSHRLWCHRSFNATLSMRIILMILNTMNMHDTIHQWSLDHRAHHKFSDTGGDPYNASNGLFYSHVGWIMVSKKQQELANYKSICMKDLESDRVVMFQKKYYIILVLLLRFALPLSILVILEERLSDAIFINFFSYALSLHYTWTVNSLAHVYGTRPYNSNILPRDNMFVNWLVYGEGYHNYHHTYPYDYKCSLNGPLKDFNLSTLFIDCFQKLGMIYETKQIDHDTKLKLLKNCEETKNNQTYFQLIKFHLYGFLIIFWPTIGSTILHYIFSK